MNLHNETMNIQIPDEVRDHCTHKDSPNGLQSAFAYKLGHRDARHTAAELSLKADARIEELESIIQGTIDCLSVSGDAEGLADFVIENLSRVFNK